MQHTSQAVSFGKHVLTLLKRFYDSSPYQLLVSWGDRASHMMKSTSLLGVGRGEVGFPFQR